MRLLHRSNDDKLRLTNDIVGDDAIPRYAILSHTWEESQEVTFQDFTDGTGQEKQGYQKLQFCAEKSKKADLSHFWVDTCCIDKNSSAVLQEAITSMFRWYRNAEKCFVYLSDVHDSDRWKSELRKSRWFMRGWTLQELLAPVQVEFYSSSGTYLGNKRTLEETIHEITGIDRDALRGKPLGGFTEEERMAWASRRETRREEDSAYSLFGIFDVHMPLIYGEGRKSAFKRLNDEIAKCRSQQQLGDDDSKECEERRRFQRQRREVLQASLPFPEMHARQATIKTAHTKTCEWLVDQPEYVNWLSPDQNEESNGPLWIKAKPGAGKSTIMKFILERLCITMVGYHMISFFFHGRGTLLELSVLGTYRSLLWQILALFPNVVHVLDTISPAKVDLTSKVLTSPWDVATLQELLRNVITALPKVSLFCLIDALDECEEEQIRDMINFMEQLSSLAASRGIYLRICLASRHYPHITIRTGSSLILDDHEGHFQDIATYLDTALKIGFSRLAQTIRATIQARASGIFMWVVLVVAILNKEYDNGRVHLLQKKLQEIPSGLHELFQDILTRDTNNNHETFLCFQWVLFSQRPLHPVELYCAILTGSNSDMCSQWNEFVTTQDVEKYILSCSKGLCEVTKTIPSRVQFIHESVREFLAKQLVLSNIRPDLDLDFEAQSHDELKHICFAYLCNVLSQNAPDSRLFRRPYDSVPDIEFTSQRYPLLAYALSSVLEHAEDAARCGLDQRDFVLRFPLARWIAYHNARTPFGTYRADASLLYILTVRNLPNLVKTYPFNLSYLNRERSDPLCPLFTALKHGHSKVVQVFVEAHAQTLEPTSPLRAQCDEYVRAERICSNRRSSNLMPTFDADIFSLLSLGDEVLLELGLDAIEKGLWTTYLHGAPVGLPLIYAARSGNNRLLQILLRSKRFNVNERDSSGHTALLLAVMKSNFDMVKELLEVGEANPFLKYARGATLLSHARRNGNNEIIQLIQKFFRSRIKEKAHSGEVEVIVISDEE